MRITMKCDNCNSEWTVAESIALTIIACPFCGEKLFNKNKKSCIEDFDISKRGILKSYLGNDCHIVIPNNVNKIKYEAFKNDSICSITIPKSVVDIDVGAFQCGDSIDIYYEGNIEQWMRIEHSGWLTSKTKYNLYLGGKLLTDVVIQQGTFVNNGAFLDCKSLKRVIVSEGVDSIPSAMLSGCISLNHVELPESILEIESGTFSGCISLENIKIPEGVITIGPSAFSSCKKLKNITIPSNLRTIKEGAFSRCSSLTNIIIPNDVNVIGGYVFSGCTSLVKVKLPDNITSIGDNFFRKCSSLQEIEIPENVTEIGLAAFGECSSLKKIKFKDPANWYNVGYILNDWISRSGGTPIDMSNSIRNVEILAKRYKDCRFYKK